MVSKYESETFRKMNVIEIKNFFIKRGVSVNGYHKWSLLTKVASAVERMPSATSGRFRTENDRLIIYEMEIGNPLKIDTVNSFIGN